MPPKKILEPLAEDALGLKLTVLEGPCAGQEHVATFQVISVGRTKASTLALIKDSSVSQTHAQFAYQGGRWLIVDRGSSNGTYMGDKQLDENEEVVLKDGDIITFGEHTKVQVQISAAAAPAAPMTVEQHYLAEAARMQRDIQDAAEAMVAEIRGEWQQRRQQLLALAS